MRYAATVAVLSLAVGLAACDRIQQAMERPADPHLTLAVETPEALDWGGSGTMRVTLINEREAPAAGGVVEVFVPTWLEFGTVEPAGTAVTVISGADETRLAYDMSDSFPPGDRRTIVQHLRVAAPPAAVSPPADTVDVAPAHPTNRVVRARLLTVAGEPTGAEVHVTLHFVGAPDPLLPPPGPPVDTLPRADTLPAVPAPTPLPRDTVADTLPRTTPRVVPPGR